MPLQPNSPLDSVFVLDVISDSGDVAHVAVTTTQPVLDCLWLEKVTRTAGENGKPLLPARQLFH